MRLLVLAFLAVVSSTAAFGQEKPVVRVQVTPDSVIVGEAVELTVTVLVPTWFTRPSVYPTFELANAMTRMPADNSYTMRERIGNESWSGIVRSYEVYPLMGATYRLGGQVMSITYANPGSEPLTVDVELSELVFRGVVPAGAESLEPYLAGRDLELSLDIEGEQDNLVAGDALVLRYTAELDGLPAIFLPPLVPDLQFDGVSIYEDVPEVEDGTLARRSEKVTLVFDAGGEFTIPDLELSYWSTETKSIETATVAGLAISVEGPPAAPASADEMQRSRWPQITWLIAGLAASLLIAWRGAPVVARRYREARERRQQSERHAFKLLSRALGSENSETVYAALLQWISRLDTGMSIRQFAAKFGDESLRAAVEALSAGIYSDAGHPGELRSVRSKLAAARRRYLQQCSPRRTPLLPPLNP